MPIGYWGRGRFACGEIDREAGWVLVGFLDTRADPDEMNCPALSWHLLDQKPKNQSEIAYAADIDRRIRSRESWRYRYHINRPDSTMWVATSERPKA